MEAVNITFREMLESLFNVDFMTEAELETICKAGELYADGRLKHFLEWMDKEGGTALYPPLFNIYKEALHGQEAK